MKMSAQCIGCVIGGREKRVRGKGNEDLRMYFLRECMRYIVEGKEETMPYLTTKMDELYERLFKDSIDYTQIKSKYNNLILKQETLIKEEINRCKQPLKRAIQFAQVGNYIDYGALEEVSEQLLQLLLDNCNKKELDEEEYNHFVNDLNKADTLVYISDNCGEIVLDRFLVETMKDLFPHLHITLLVRGDEVLNDATRVDVKEVGFESVCDIKDTGIAMCGCDLNHISKEAYELVSKADVIIAKGQANFETLFGNNLPVYYLLLCKCDMFVSRFNMEKLAPVFIKEERIVIHNK